MGLFDIEGADPEEYPDNKGGRPPKEETEEEKKEPRYAVEPYPPEDEPEDEYVQRIWENLHDGDIVETIQQMVDYMALPPWEVMRLIHEHEIRNLLDYDETPYSRDYLRHAGILDSKEAKQKNVMSMLGSGGSSNGDGDDDDEPSSGLQSLIDG